MIFFVPVKFNQKVIITSLNLTQTIEVEKCFYEWLILSLLSEGSLIDRYHSIKGENDVASQGVVHRLSEISWKTDVEDFLSLSVSH